MTLNKIIIIIVGIGGTGGNLAKELCRFTSSLYGKEIKIIFMDGDKVEKKNCSRQPFSEYDIEENKAVVLSELCNLNFNINVSAIPEYLTEKEQIINICNKNRDFFPILVGTVDNHPARQILHQIYNNTDNICYIDSANERWNGEVVSSFKLNKIIISPPRGFYFPDVLTDNTPGKAEESCGVINITSPQHLVTNLWAANIILSDIVNLIINGCSQAGISLFNVLDKSVEFIPYKAYDKKVVSHV